VTRRVVVVVLDGLRRDALGPELTPNLMRFAEGAARCSRFRSAFPSATRVVSATFATGCYPARHGLAGNSMALLEHGALVRHDAGQPDFLQHRRRVTGRALDEPTLAERLAGAGGAELFSNVSPGAAYAHDPDGFGHVHHRAGSFGPGRMAIAPLEVQLDIAGDRMMTERFVAEAVDGRRPALAVLWLGEPDHSQHENPLGSPACRAAIAAADRRFAAVRAAVERRRTAGEDVLLIAMSDHGHRTVTEVIDIDAEMARAGLKGRAEDMDLIAVSSGTAALLYLHPMRATDARQVTDWLRAQPWAGEVLEGEALTRVGQTPAGCLAWAVSMRSDDDVNAFGVPGGGPAARPHAGKPDRLSCGQHGGLSPWEQMPFLMIEGAGFAPGGRLREASTVDLAPTILCHLGHNFAGLDGAPLQAENAIAASPTRSPA